MNTNADHGNNFNPYEPIYDKIGVEPIDFGIRDYKEPKTMSNKPILILSIITLAIAVITLIMVIGIRSQLPLCYK